MIETMLALGPYRFAVSTAAYESLRRTSEYRWPAQERLGRAPARQFVGPGADSVTLSGVIYPHYAGGLSQIGKLRELAGRGVPLSLVDGRGMVWGRWCIERIEEGRTVFFANGDPQRVEFTMQLSAYGEEV